MPIDVMFVRERQIGIRGYKAQPLPNVSHRNPQPLCFGIKAFTDAALLLRCEGWMAAKCT